MRQAAILVGGVGTRLRPLTYVVPKCMLPMGGKPLLERTLDYLRGFGITDVVLCVAYLKHQIMDYFGNGNGFGVRIRYAEADMPLGTAGQLKTAEPFIRGTFLAMNGDIVTTLNIPRLIAFHAEHAALGTIALKRFEVKIPYGYVTINDDATVAKFEEKPTLSYLANAGFYVLEKAVFNHIPKGKVVSLETEVFPSLLEQGLRLNAYFEDAYWADVGSMTDFERVDQELLTQYLTSSASPQAKT